MDEQAKRKERKCNSNPKGKIQTLTSSEKRNEIQIEKKKGLGKEKGKQEQKNLAGRRENPSPAREKKTEPGSLLAGLGQGVTAARPLDGGALTR